MCQIGGQEIEEEGGAKSHKEKGRKRKQANYCRNFIFDGVAGEKVALKENCTIFPLFSTYAGGKVFRSGGKKLHTFILYLPASKKRRSIDGRTPFLTPPRVYDFPKGLSWLYSFPVGKRAEADWSTRRGRKRRRSCFRKPANLEKKKAAWPRRCSLVRPLSFNRLSFLTLVRPPAGEARDDSFLIFSP